MWYSILYTLAEGKATEIQSVLNLNHRMVFTHIMFERNNKKLAEWYGHIRYNTT